MLICTDWEKYPEQCCALVSKGTTWHRYRMRCTRNKKVEREGRPYCGKHDPVKVAEKYAKRQMKWDENDKRRARERITGNIGAAVVESYKNGSMHMFPPEVSALLHELEKYK